MKIKVLTAFFLLLKLNLWGQLPYQNPGLSSENRVRDLLSRFDAQ